MKNYDIIVFIYCLILWDMNMSTYGNRSIVKMAQKYKDETKAISKRSDIEKEHAYIYIKENIDFIKSSYLHNSVRYTVVKEFKCHITQNFDIVDMKGLRFIAFRNGLYNYEIIKFIISIIALFCWILSCSHMHTYYEDNTEGIGILYIFTGIIISSVTFIVISIFGLSHVNYKRK